MFVVKLTAACTTRDVDLMKTFLCVACVAVGPLPTPLNHLYSP